MAIKSKKWKPFISFGTFFLGVSLAAAGIGQTADRCFGYSRPGVLTEVFARDYQNTEDFRWQMAGTLSDFLAMATGGEPGRIYGAGSGEYWYDYGSSSYGDYLAACYDGEVQEAVAGDMWGMDTVVQEAWPSKEEAAEATGAEWFELDIADDEKAGSRLSDGMEEKERKEREERNAEAAKRYHESIREDKNLLYRISCDGKELYSNMEDAAWNAYGDPLPEGYNFLLYYDGEKVQAMKDGEELNLYGDGYYRGEAGQWYVPGYRNFTVDEELKKAQIVMIAAKEPADYVYVKYGNDGYSRYGSSLYWIAEKTRRNYEGMQSGLICLAAGILLLGISVPLRKNRKDGNAAIGGFLGKIWFEPKAVLLLILIVGAIAPFFSRFRYEYAYLYEEMVYGGYWDSYVMWDISQDALQELVSTVAGRPFALLFLVWSIYFLALDIRANGKRFFTGGISRLAGCIETKSLSLPFTKRMIFRFLLVLLVSAVLIATEFALVFSLSANGDLAYFVWENGATAVLLFLIPPAMFAAVCVWYLVRTRKQAGELERIAGRVRAIHDGDYGETEDMADCEELKEMAEDLGGIRAGMEKAVEERMKSERMKVELVANVSHDIRTPLTSIISYVQFLKQEPDLPDHIKDYICILDEKSQRLNNMVQDVFAISKAASDQLPVKLERIDFGKLLRQTLADMDEQIRKSPVTVRAVIPEHEVAIHSDGSRMYRVFQNLIQNALQYSLEGSRVFVELREDASFAVACIRNVSRQELTKSTDFTERFVRGDASRTDGGSGLGLSIAKSFTEACGGRFEVETNADLFVVTVSFVRV